MALTKDVIIANGVLATLTPDQITAIETLSVNDETTVIGTKIGTLHGRYDTDILEVSGVAKKQGEHSYEYAKRVIADFKTKVESSSTLATEVTSLKADKLSLEKQIREGGSDAALKQQLKDTETRLSQIQTTYDTEKATFATEKTELQKQVNATHVNYAFDMATTGLKFKATIPDSVKEVLIKNAKSEILATSSPDFVETGGKKVLVFRDANGNILNNQENKLNPFTASELITSKLKDVLDFGKQQSGGGTGPNNDKSENVLDTSTAKTQIEADDLIAKHLMSIGLTRQNPEFAKEQAKIRKENGVDKLPMR